MEIINVMERDKQIPKLNLLDCVTEISKSWQLDVKKQTKKNQRCELRNHRKRAAAFYRISK